MLTEPFSVAELHDLAMLEGLPDDQLRWLARHGDRVALAKGQRLVSRGDRALFMFLVVAGEIQRYEEIGGQWLIVATTGRGQVTGMLPFSRMTAYPGHMIANQPTTILRLPEADFGEMLGISPELGRRLVAEMMDRVRGDVRLEQQRDRLMALGRLSAGLAHELNNPASGATRAAASLTTRLGLLHGIVVSLVRCQLDEAAMARVAAHIRQVSARGEPALTAMARSAREDELTDWFDARQLSTSWDVVGPFVESGCTVADLERVATEIPPADLGECLSWFSWFLSTTRMAGQIGSATARISNLVDAVKSYSQMDRSTEHKPTDVREGLDSTLIMLGHRIKMGTISVAREYPDDLPLIEANAGELNQVWTALIDNALDAMGSGGHLRLETRHEHRSVVVAVADDGPGIADDALGRIFDPFFTTKGVGEGYGLGLDIALRIVSAHQGQIDVRTQPGRTEVRVRLPRSPATFRPPGTAEHAAIPPGDVRA